MPTTLPKIRKQVRPSIELNQKEIKLLEDIMFRAVVSCMQELNGYTRRNENGTDFQRETVEELKYLRGIQSKLDHAAR
jgi:hypothetical protein